MVDPFCSRLLHSLSPSGPQGVVSHSRFGFLDSITDQKSLGFPSPLPQTTSAPLFRALFSSFSRSLFLFSPV
ncbi:hypothetical protein TNCV_2730121 [Trichonephila clavipes]|nr:hypothetical protein TNCV_2730121 [Trichonephila clavipes]